MKQLCVTTRAEWRRWLRRNHGTSEGVWLVCPKKHTGKPSPDYDAIVEEALCFGWIDSTVKRVDDETYLRKLTPRRTGSNWSDSNKTRVARLERQGLMTEAGARMVRDGRASGQWDRPVDAPVMPTALRRALAHSRKAKTFFDQLAPSYRKQFMAWVGDAKRQETQDRRVREAIALMRQGKRLGQ